MITRTFKKGARTLTISFPKIMEWKLCSYVVDIDGQRIVHLHPSNEAARQSSWQAVSEALSSGWVEQMAQPRRVQPTLAEAVDEVQQKVIAAVIAADLPATPDWAKVWDQIAKGVPQTSVRRKLLAAVQAAHKDRIDEQERLARLKVLAETEEVKAAAAREKEARLKQMALVMAQQEEPASGQRKIDFEA